MQCGDCEKEYLGQSKRQFGTRLKEHTVSKVCLGVGCQLGIVSCYLLLSLFL